MSESIETFVQKLQQDGVAAGRAQAEQIVAEADAQAGRITQEARAEARRIVEEAREQAKRLADAQANELRLAARDALLKLRDEITSTLEGVLRRRVAEHLQDGDFLRDLIAGIARSYATDEASGEGRVRIKVNDEVIQQVGDWALDEVASGRVKLQGTLKGAGFEYTVRDATVEVTVDAVVEVLRGMVSARLQQVLAEAARD